MPLENAKEGTPGFGRNIKREIEAGKPQKQAVAIAYSKARGDASPGYTEIWCDGSLDQEVVHTHNYKEIIAREKKDLQKMGCTVKLKHFGPDGKAMARLDGVDEPLTVDSLLREADALYSRSDAMAEGKWAEQCEKDADERWIVLIGGSTAGRAGTVHKTEAEAKARAAELRRIIKKEGNTNEVTYERDSSWGIGDAALPRFKVKQVYEEGEHTWVVWDTVHNDWASEESSFYDRFKAEAEAKRLNAKYADAAPYEHKYNPEGVNQAIAAQNRSGRGKIGGREAKMIHSLLKGNEGYAARNPRKDGSFDFAYNADIKYAKEQLAAVKKAWPGRPDHPEIKALENRIKMLQREKRSRNDSEPATLDKVLQMADEMFARSDAVFANSQLKRDQIVRVGGKQVRVVSTDPAPGVRQMGVLVDNPDKEVWFTTAEIDTADEAIEGCADASSPQPGDQVTIKKEAFERLRAGGYNGPRVVRVKEYRGGDVVFTNGGRAKAAEVDSVRADAEADAAPASLKQHSQYTSRDYEYFKAKGWSDNEIKQRWDKEAKAGNKPETWTGSTTAEEKYRSVTGRKDAAEFSTTKYEFSHSKKPKGTGSWAFLVDGETVFCPGQKTLSEAKDWVRKQHPGARKIEVAP